MKKPFFKKKYDKLKNKHQLAVENVVNATLIAGLMGVNAAAKNKQEIQSVQAALAQQKQHSSVEQAATLPSQAPYQAPAGVTFTESTVASVIPTDTVTTAAPTSQQPQNSIATTTDISFQQMPEVNEVFFDRYAPVPHTAIDENVEKQQFVIRDLPDATKQLVPLQPHDQEEPNFNQNIQQAPEPTLER